MAFALTFVFNTLAVLEINAQGALQEVLKRMDDHNKALTSLQADVKMVKFNAQLNESDPAQEGPMKYLPRKGRNAYVRIDWTKPLQESLAVVDKDYVLYRPHLKQAYTGKTDKAKNSGGAGNALAFMNMSKTQLKQNYEIIYVGKENVSGGIPTWHLQLTPKTPQNYKMAEIWVDGNGMPIQAKTIENNNDSMTVYLSNLQKNKSIDGSIFKIDLPKGTKIIK